MKLIIFAEIKCKIYKAFPISTTRTHYYGIITNLTNWVHNILSNIFRTHHILKVKNNSVIIRIWSLPNIVSWNNIVIMTQIIVQRISCSLFLLFFVEFFLVNRSISNNKISQIFNRSLLSIKHIINLLSLLQNQQ